MAERHISMSLLVIPVAAYFLGSIPFGLILTKLFGGADVRTVGSGNIGATNVARAAGPLAGVFRLILDAGRGAGAVLLGERLSNDSAPWMMFAALAVLRGHCCPVSPRFEAGKGAGTAAAA